MSFSTLTITAHSYGDYTPRFALDALQYRTSSNLSLLLIVSSHALRRTCTQVHVEHSVPNQRHLDTSLPAARKI
jgi:hypothetical protein